MSHNRELLEIQGTNNWERKYITQRRRVQSNNKEARNMHIVQQGQSVKHRANIIRMPFV